MTPTRLIAAAAVLLAGSAGSNGIAASSGGASVETEDFNRGVFANPFFQHDIEFDGPCCWEFVFRNETDSLMLHLRPNNDLITFDLAPGRSIEQISVTVLDYEGGFVGTSPTSAIVVRAASGDFVALHADDLGVLQTVTATVDTPGQLTGEPLGEIVSVRLDAANEGNAVFPLEVGAYFDDLTVVVGGPIPGDVNHDGVVDFHDLLLLLAAWGDCPPGGPCPADIDGNLTVDFGDLLVLLANWS